MSKSALCSSNIIDKNHAENIALVYKADLKSQIAEVLSENEDDIENISDEDFRSESSFTLKQPSLVDFYLKTQSWNLGKLNLKVLGFKTYFNGYMEDIEVYAEPINRFENDPDSKEDFSDINN
jgi:hypothetical protein